MIPVRQKLIDYHDVEGALADLCRGLCSHDGACLKCEQVDPQEIPAPFDQLLVHHDHMTTKLGDHFGRPVELEVLQDDLDAGLTAGGQPPDQDMLTVNRPGYFDPHLPSRKAAKIFQLPERAIQSGGRDFQGIGNGNRIPFEDIEAARLQIEF